ncbi:AAA family ATPase [Isoptericola sp. NPDC056578]|uniref:AAA family ATPase n=1 Tax=Isoptericola sp. NPDC056578 TaxID=3345870 RepID=UPI0036C1A3DA
MTSNGQMHRTGLVTLADVLPERVAWLWPGRLPAGKLVVIDGDPSTGKSTLALDLAAHVSTGAPWPDSAPCGKGDVLLLSAEDGLADTISPRLVAAGADRRRVHALLGIEVVDGDGDVRQVPPSLPRDIGVMREIVDAYGVRLVVVDVLMAYLNGTVDSHRDQDVRGVLHQLATMAEDTGATVVLIRHLNKAGGGNALYRGGGSIGIVGAARAAFLVARDPDDIDRRILAVTKSNLAAEAPALAYRLVSDPETDCARVVWEPEPVDGMTATELLRGPIDDDERSERDQCAEWLADYLMTAGGEARPDDIQKAGRIAGWSIDQLKRSKKKAGVRSATAGIGKGWVWTLAPKGAPKGAREQSPGSRSLAPLPAPLCGTEADEREVSAP